MNLDTKQKQIIELLTSSGTSDEVVGNIRRAITLAHEAKEEVGMANALDGVSAIVLYDSENACVDGVAGKLKGILSIGQFDIYSGYARNNETSQVGGGVILFVNGDKRLQVTSLYRDIGTVAEIELESLLLSLKIASTQLQYADKITIYASSTYAVNAISVWSYTWRSNGWRKSGGAIKNLKIIQEAHELFDKIKKKVSFCLVDFKDADEQSKERQDVLRECKALSKEVIKEKIYGAKVALVNTEMEG